MKLKNIVNDINVQNARCIFYLVLFAFYIYLNYFSNFSCSGCILCGMTRAVNSLLKLDFRKAFEYNNMVWIFYIIIPIIVIDMSNIIIKRFFFLYNKIYKNF